MKTANQLTEKPKRPQILDLFREPHTLRSLEAIAHLSEFPRFTEARDWIEQKLKERKHEYAQIVTKCRDELFDGDCDTVKAAFMARVVAQAEIAELELLARELAYCIHPQSIQRELMRQALRDRPKQIDPNSMSKTYS